jgi:dipeptidyl aminopeptidase/acylaminoacyl peptidase
MSIMVEITNVFYSRGIPLEGNVSFPDSPKGPCPLVLLCHGHSRNKNDGLDFLAQELASQGIASFRIDFRGCSGTIGRFDLLPRLNWRDDIDNALVFITHEEGIDPERIGMAGISMGGSMTLNSAANDIRIKCAVAMAPISDLRRNFYNIWKNYLGEKGFADMLRLLEEDKLRRVRTGISGFISSAYLCGKTGQEELEYLYDNCREQIEGRYNNNYVTLEGVEDTLKFVPENDAEKIAIPIMFVHGKNDCLVAISESEKVYERIKSKHKELYLVEGCDHNIPQDPRRKEVFPRIAAWFRQYL